MEEAALLKLLLTDHDTPCPRCGYNLRDLESNRCPECGHFLTTDEVFPGYRAKPVGVLSTTVHTLNLAAIGFVGVVMTLCILSRFVGGSFDFSPEITLIVCVGAAFLEWAKVGELMKYTPAWALVFNPVTYFGFFLAILVGTSHLGFV